MLQCRTPLDCVHLRRLYLQALQPQARSCDEQAMHEPVASLDDDGQMQQQQQQQQQQQRGPELFALENDPATEDELVEQVLLRRSDAPSYSKGQKQQQQQQQLSQQPQRSKSGFQAVKKPKLPEHIAAPALRPPPPPPLQQRAAAPAAQSRPKLAAADAAQPLRRALAVAAGRSENGLLLLQELADGQQCVRCAAVAHRLSVQLTPSALPFAFSDDDTLPPAAVSNLRSTSTGRERAAAAASSSKPSASSASAAAASASLSLRDLQPPPLFSVILARCASEIALQFRFELAVGGGACA
jgi:hypothetical protein